MKTKAEIVQNLLDAHQITAEQAVILLTGDSKEKEYIFIPANPCPVYPINPYPVYPWRWNEPYWQFNPLPNYSVSEITATPSEN